MVTGVLGIVMAYAPRMSSPKSFTAVVRVPPTDVQAFALGLRQWSAEWPSSNACISTV